MIDEMISNVDPQQIPKELGSRLLPKIDVESSLLPFNSLSLESFLDPTSTSLIDATCSISIL